MNELAFATITQLQKKIRTKEITAQELIRFFYNRFERFDKQIGSAIELFEPEDIEHTGPLAGIPGLIKDNIAIKNRTLTCASKILQGFVSPYDATAIARLKNQSAPLIGRANMDEFGMGSSTETSAYQKTKNPWNLARVAGGSSGGSAAAVAAGLSPWSLGSETGGSVRQPAGFCGIVGLKPTYGRISRFGLVAYGSSLDQIGICSRTVQDAALLFSCLAGHDERDATTLNLPSMDFTASLSDKLKAPITIGIVKEALFAKGIDNEIITALQAAIKQFEAMGYRIKELSLPALDYSAATYFIISRAEAASNLARFDGVRYGARNTQAHSLHELYMHTRGNGFGDEVKKRIIMGNYVLSAGFSGEFYANAQRVRNVIAAEFATAFSGVDLLFMPTHPIPAFSFNAFDDNKLQMDLQDYFTCPVNLAGLPAISIPCGFTKDQLPIGMQLIAPHAAEERLFQVGHAYQQVTDWHVHHPKQFV